MTKERELLALVYYWFFAPASLPKPEYVRSHSFYPGNNGGSMFPLKTAIVKYISEN